MSTSTSTSTGLSRASDCDEVEEDEKDDDEGNAALRFPIAREEGPNASILGAGEVADAVGVGVLGAIDVSADEEDMTEPFSIGADG